MSDLVENPDDQFSCAVAHINPGHVYSCSIRGPGYTKGLIGFFPFLHLSSAKQNCNNKGFIVVLTKMTLVNLENS